MASDDTLLKTLIVIVAVALLAPILVLAVMIPVMGMWGRGWHVGDAGMGPMGAWWPWLLMMVPLLLVVLVLGYLLYRGFQDGDGGTDPALEELRVAYARGDLSDEEFEERRDRLQRES